MEEKQSGVGRPWWVGFALWGLPNRGSALASLWFLVAIAAASVLYGFRDVRFSLGGVAILPALWYLGAVRWVDRHGGWPAKSRG
jgi:hypothetical protein